MVIVLYQFAELKLPRMYYFQVYVFKDAELAELCLEGIWSLLSVGRNFEICHSAPILSISYRILNRVSKK